MPARLLFVLIAALALAPAIARADLLAGVAAIDITDRDAGPVHDPLFAKALVLKSGATSIVIVTVDAVAIGEIGRIGNEYLPEVRSRIEQELGIPSTNVLINASHCHGVVRHDVADLTVQAVNQAASKLVPVRIGVGRGHEDRIMENRRLMMKDGSEIDVRHAYSMPPDEEVAGVGPIDPEIGVMRFDRIDGTTLAVLYNFACHPIQGVPSGENTADITGFASKAIEESVGGACIAMFLQGCGGDINPVYYKDVDHPRDAEPLGNMLGLSVIRALRKIEVKSDDRLQLHNESLALPRADLAQKIISMRAKRDQLAQSLRGTTLNLKTFMPLIVKYRLSEQFPSHYSLRYLQEKTIGRGDLAKLDADNRIAIKKYIENIHIMESLTRLNTNLALLRKHQQQNVEAGSRQVIVELLGLRIGDLVLTTFPGELTVQIGLNLKRDSPHEFTFVAGYTNGYIYYAPTTEQLRNVGNAQEDSDCILAPHWQPIYEKKASSILRRLRSGENERAID